MQNRFKSTNAEHAFNSKIFQLSDKTEKLFKLILKPLYLVIKIMISKFSSPGAFNRKKKKSNRIKPVNKYLYLYLRADKILDHFYSYSTKFFENCNDNYSKQSTSLSSIQYYNIDDRRVVWDFQSYVHTSDEFKFYQLKRYLPNDSFLKKSYVKISNYLLIHFELDKIRFLPERLNNIIQKHKASKNVYFNTVKRDNIYFINPENIIIKPMPGKRLNQSFSKTNNLRKIISPLRVLLYVKKGIHKIEIKISGVFLPLIKSSFPGLGSPY